jgi:hypothetical protein
MDRAAKRWRNALLMACVIHTLPEQNIMASLALTPMIVHMVNAQKKRKTRVNSTSETFFCRWPNSDKV